MPVVLRRLRFAVVAATLWYLGVYRFVASHRLAYPFDLEWIQSRLGRTIPAPG